MTDGSPASGTKHPSAAPPPTRSTLLLVEDDQVTAMLAQRILSEDGYRVLLTRNGEDGLRMWQNHLAQSAESGLSSDGRIALVIADLAMPGLNRTRYGAPDARRDAVGSGTLHIWEFTRHAGSR